MEDWTGFEAINWQIVNKSKQQSSSAIVMPPLIRNLQTGEEFIDIIPDQTAEFFLGQLSYDPYYMESCNFVINT